MNKEKSAQFYKGSSDTLILSYLQGHMGYAISDSDENPRSVIIVSGDFCFPAGQPDASLLDKLKAPKLIAPVDTDWLKLIENHFGDRVRKFLRYAIKGEPGIFDIEKLEKYASSLKEGFELRLFDKEIFEMARGEAWSADLCSRFRDYDDYRDRALGTAVLHNGILVSGASPYAVYDGGLEIEIDTREDYRRMGLATACGAKFILECLKRNIYPSWDAHDLRSVALAEKLGYHMDHEYLTYELMAD